ncbi:MAG TPA: hypothetical protein VGM88_19405 [Kofleriaceae bacterium]|jgi:hypothetical protein
MRRAVALVAALSLGSCAFAVKHPAITAGLAGGALAGGLCELNVSDQKACALTTAGAGVGLAAIVLLAILIGGDGHTILVTDPDQPQPQQPLAPDPIPGPPGASLPPPPAPPPAPPLPDAPPTDAPPADAR